MSSGAAAAEKPQFFPLVPVSTPAHICEIMVKAGYSRKLAICYYPTAFSLFRKFCADELCTDGTSCHACQQFPEAARLDDRKLNR
jgi:hypothetical protein